LKHYESKNVRYYHLILSLKVNETSSVKTLRLYFIGKQNDTSTNLYYDYYKYAHSYAQKYIYLRYTQHRASRNSID